MIKHHFLGAVLAAAFLCGAAHGQGISQKVAVCNPGYTNRCMAPDINGAIPITGSLTPAGTQDVNVAQIGGNAVTTTLPVSDAGGSLTVDTLQLPSTLGIKTASASLSIAPASDSTFPVTQSGTWNITNISGTVSLPTGASTAANQATGNASLSSIDSKLTAPLSVAGPVASGATDSGNPVKVGGVYNSTLPTFTTGQRADWQLTSRGEGLVTISAGGQAATITSTVTDNAATTNNRLYVAAANQIFDGTAWTRARTILGVDGTGLGVQATTIAPVSAATGAITPTVTAAVASNLVAKASAGNLYGFHVTAGASAGYVLLFNATSLPADGAITPQGCYALAANTTLVVDLRPLPKRFATGITIGYSTTGCFTLTASATAFISADVQ